MLLKSFEINSFDKKVQDESFIIRSKLGQLKDALNYSIENKEYLTEEIKQRIFFKMP